MFWMKEQRTKYLLLEHLLDAITGIAPGDASSLDLFIDSRQL